MICQPCGGTGRIPATRGQAACPFCDGTGQRPPLHDVAMGADAHKETKRGTSAP